MSPATIIREAQADGVRLTLSPSGTIRVAGDKAVLGRWLPVLRERKAEIIAALSAMIRKRDTGNLATATETGANTPNFCGAPSTRETWWRIVLATGEEKIITTSPPATLEELKVLYPEAFSIEPYQRQVKRLERPLTPEEERTILAFLASIGEEDKEIIAEVMEACRCDQEAREYYLRRAKL